MNLGRGFPIQLCEVSGICQSVARNDARLLQTLGVLHPAYYQGDEDNSRKWRPLVPKNWQLLIDGTTMEMDALELTFKGEACGDEN